MNTFARHSLEKKGLLDFILLSTIVAAETLYVKRASPHAFRHVIFGFPVHANLWSGFTQGATSTVL